MTTIFARMSFVTHARLRRVNRQFRHLASREDLRRERVLSGWNEQVVFISGSQPAGGELVPNRLAMLAEGRWYELAPMPTRLSLHVTFECNGTLLLAGGNGETADPRPFIRDVQIYRPIRNRWELLAPVPEDYQNCRCCAFMAPSSVVTIGFGVVGRIRIARFDWEANVWTVVPADPEHDLFFGAATAALGNDFYAFGGLSQATNEGVTTVRVFSFENMEWRNAEPMPDPKVLACAISIGDRAYVVAGTGVDGPVRSLFVYDARENTWERAQDIPENGPSGRCTIGMAQNGNFLVSGPYGVPGVQPKLARYNTQDLTWTLFPENHGFLQRLRQEAARNTLPNLALL